MKRLMLASAVLAATALFASTSEAADVTIRIVNQNQNINHNGGYNRGGRGYGYGGNYGRGYGRGYYGGSYGYRGPNTYDRYGSPRYQFRLPSRSFGRRYYGPSYRY